MKNTAKRHEIIFLALLAILVLTALFAHPIPADISAIGTEGNLGFEVFTRPDAY